MTFSEFSKNFITCNAADTIADVVQQFSESNTNLYVLVVDGDTLCGVLTTSELKPLIPNKELTKAIRCVDFIRTLTQAAPFDITEDELLQRMIDYELDYVVLKDGAGVFVHVVTLKSMLKDIIAFKKVIGSLTDVADEDVQILNQLRMAEYKYGFLGIVEGIVYYKPLQPIPLDLSIDELLAKVKQCILKNCNSAYAEMFGTTREALIYKQTIADRLPDNVTNRKLFDHILQNEYRSDSVESHEFDVNGQDKWFLNHAFFEINNNAVTGIWSRKHDITEQKEMQIALEIRAEVIRSQERLAHTANWQYSYSDKKLIFSDEFVDLFDMEVHSAKTMLEPKNIYEYFLKYVDKEYLQKVHEAHQAVINSGIAFDMLYNVTTQQGKRKNLQEHCKIIFSEDGLPYCAIGTLQDVTLIKKLELASWQHQERFNDMFINSSDSMLIFDIRSDNQFVLNRINPAAIRLVELDIVNSKNIEIADVFTDSSDIQLNTLLQKVIKEKSSSHHEMQCHFPSGTKFIAITIVPIHSQNKDIIQLIVIMNDITFKIAIEKKQRHLNWTLSAMNKSNTAISHSRSEAELIKECCEAVTSENKLFTDCCILEVNDSPNQPLKLLNFSSNGNTFAENKLIQQGDMLCHDVIMKAIFSRNIEKHVFIQENEQPYLFPQNKAYEDNTLKSVLVLPLIIHDKVNMLLVVYSKSADSFDNTEQNLFKELIANIIYGIEHKRTQLSLAQTTLIKDEQSIKLQHSLENTVGAIGAMLEFRDPFTAGHQKRVSNLSVAIAEAYGLSPERIQWLNIAACVHDIGKITIPSEILSKPSKLSAPEYAMIKTHPEVGYQILKNIDFPGPIAEIIHQHHEYLDGSGYPYGLKGNEIMLESKILTVADIVEAMSSHRPYRPAFGIKFALDEIKRMREIKLDAKAVDICVSLFENNQFQFPEVDHFNKGITSKMYDHSRS